METGAQMFEPDGWSYRARIGLLVPDGDVGPESEFSAMVPPGVGVNASRFRFPSGQDAKAPGQIGMTPIEALCKPGPLDDAVRLIARAPVDVIALAFTSTSYIGGDDPGLADRLAGVSDGKPVVTTGQAFLQVLSHLGASRVMLVDPPWFPPALTELGEAWLMRNGATVVSAQSAGLPTGQGNIHPGGFYRWIRDNVPPGVDAVLVGGNGFRSVGAVNWLEADLKIPVNTANTALLWLVLKTLGIPTSEVVSYGQLFSER